jgi:hypothetical protein
MLGSHSAKARDWWLLPGLALVAFTAGCGARTGLDVSGRANALRDGGTDLDGAPRADAGSAADLNGLRWELPCIQGTEDPTVCATPAARSVAATMGGIPGVTYWVTLRFRGVVEISQYVGGTPVGEYWQIGGSPPAGSTINVYGLTVSSPPEAYFLNRGISHRVVVALDYDETISIAAGAVVTLRANSRDSFELRNLDSSGRPLVIDGVPPAPAPFDGQFVQMDVVSITQQ